MTDHEGDKGSDQDDGAQYFDEQDSEAEHHLSHAAQVLVTADAHGGDAVWTRPRSFRVNAVQHEVKTSKSVTLTRPAELFCFGCSEPGTQATCSHCGQRFCMRCVSTCGLCQTEQCEQHAAVHDAACPSRQRGSSETAAKAASRCSRNANRHHILANVVHRGPSVALLTANENEYAHVVIDTGCQKLHRTGHSLRLEKIVG